MNFHAEADDLTPDVVNAAERNFAVQSYNGMEIILDARDPQRAGVTDGQMALINGLELTIFSNLTLCADFGRVGGAVLPLCTEVTTSGDTTMGIRGETLSLSTNSLDDARSGRLSFVDAGSTDSMPGAPVYGVAAADLVRNTRGVIRLLFENMPLSSSFNVTSMHVDPVTSDVNLFDIYYRGSISDDFQLAKSQVRASFFTGSVSQMSDNLHVAAGLAKFQVRTSDTGRLEILMQSQEPNKLIVLNYIKMQELL